jgi:hypothetical protein
MTSNRGSLADKLDLLPSLSRERLGELWEKLRGKPPPKAASKTLILRAVAYSVQEKELGGLKKHELRALVRMAGEPAEASHDPKKQTGVSQLNKEKPATKPRARAGDLNRKTLIRPTLRPGTRLIRNWQGKAHVVDVYHDGLGWNGKIYKSLTAIALEITGVHWSGPRFFRT